MNVPVDVFVPRYKNTWLPLARSAEEAVAGETDALPIPSSPSSVPNTTVSSPVFETTTAFSQAARPRRGAW